MIMNNGFVNATIICNGRKEVDLDALNLLAAGELPVFCSCVYKNENKHHHFAYTVDELTSFTKTQATLSFRDAVEILSASLEMLSSIEKYNLSLDNVKTAREYLFCGQTGYKFVYIPIVHKPRMTVRDYLIKLVSVIHFKDAKLNQFVKELRKKKDNAQARALLEAFVNAHGLSYDNSESETSLLSSEGETTLLNAEGETTLLGSNENAASSWLSVDDSESETTVLSRRVEQDCFEPVSALDDSARLTEYYRDESGECETTVLTSQPFFQPQTVERTNENEFFLHLIRSRNGEKVTIDVTPFTIGKDSANMDYTLNNDSVSRHHATIIFENGSYFIMDNHSTNGTTIEGIRLQPDEKGEIENGYIITLGSESFQAHIERRNDI